MPKVSIYTQVYNARPYLRQCIDSVLAQTHTDWEHIIADAGSTDGSVEILREYAASDSRVKFIQLPENRWSQYEMTEQYATGEYYASLDHDDWWAPEFLERLLGFMQKNHLDLAVTGVMQYFQEEKTTVCLRKLPKPMVFTLEKFAKHYDEYGAFVNARWASIMPTKLYLSMKKEYDEVLNAGYVWRSDTILMLNYLPHFRRIGIDGSAMQYYRKHGASQIHQHEKGRFEAQLLYLGVVEDFLKRNHGFTPKTEAWLKAQGISEIKGTFLHIFESELSGREKLEEIVPILSHPKVGECLDCQCSLLDLWYETLAKLLLNCMEDDEVSNGRIQAAVEPLASQCSPMIPYVEKSFWNNHPDCLSLLLQDNAPALRMRLLDLIEQGTEGELGAALWALLPENSPLKLAENRIIYQKHPDICRFILNGAYVTALDLMTGMLLEGKAVHEEDFLQVYLNLSAQMGQVSAFLYGKTQLAQLYGGEGRWEECRAVLGELEEMGAGEQEEVRALRVQLDMKE